MKMMHVFGNGMFSFFSMSCFIFLLVGCVPESGGESHQLDASAHSVYSTDNIVELISAASGSKEISVDWSIIGIDTDGTVFPDGNSISFDWNTSTSNKLDLEKTFDKSFRLRIEAMGKTETKLGPQYGNPLPQFSDTEMLPAATIDRDSVGLLGVCGSTEFPCSDNGGIHSNEGILVGLDLSDFDREIVFQLIGVKVKWVGGAETGTIVNKNNTLLEKTFGSPGTGTDVEISDEGTVDVSDLGIELRGRQHDSELFSVFNTQDVSYSGNFRVKGFAFKVSVAPLNEAVNQNDTFTLISSATGSEGHPSEEPQFKVEHDDGQISEVGGWINNWNPSGVFSHGETLGRTFGLSVAAMGRTAVAPGIQYGEMLSTAGIDRDSIGLIGVRGNTNGIDSNEGIRLGLDLRSFNSSVEFKFKEVRVQWVNGSETGVIVNRKNTIKRLSFGAPGTGADVEILSGAIDVSDLDITLRGGEWDTDLASIFSTANSGSFRFEGITFSVSTSDPVGKFDYSKMANHPRLIMNTDAQNELLKALKDAENPMDDHWVAIHNHIIDSCEEILAYDEEKDLKYERIGSKKRLLDTSREALRRIFYLSYCYRMTEDTNYSDKAIEYLITVSDSKSCEGEEEGSYTKTDGTVVYTRNCFIDWNPSHYLDVGEMTMAVAIGYDWLYHLLNAETKRNIRDAIVHNAFYTSFGQTCLTFHGNWNSVVNAGLIYGALAIYEYEKALAAAIIDRAMEDNPIALSDYAPDGNYIEGPGYWVYGTSFQAMLSAALESALKTDNGLSSAEGFYKSAGYIMYSTGPTGKVFNYSDCGDSPEIKPISFWMAHNTNDNSLLFEERKLMNRYVVSNDRLLPIAVIFGHDVHLDNLEQPSSKIWTGRGTTPVVIVRTAWDQNHGKYLGIKGGTASTSHAHMDAGAFVYDANGFRWAEDLGMQPYRPVEDAEISRWDRFRNQNMNHNTLSINSEPHNVSEAAVFNAYYETPSMLGARIDLTNVLNRNHELDNATRDIWIEDEERLQIVDTVQPNGAPVQLNWNMVTSAWTEIVNDNTIRLNQGICRMLLSFNSNNTFILNANRSTWPGNDIEAQNEGKVMVGFIATIPANSEAIFNTTLEETSPNPALVHLISKSPLF